MAASGRSTATCPRPFRGIS
ncbi:hypothetical protein [Nostoc sp. FACHB-110]